MTRPIASLPGLLLRRLPGSLGYYLASSKTVNETETESAVKGPRRTPVVDMTNCTFTRSLHYDAAAVALLWRVGVVALVDLDTVNTACDAASKGGTDRSPS
jgi:hypothetical protein